MIGSWEQEEDSLILGGNRGAGCLLIEVRRFAGDSFPEVGLELPKGD